MSSPLHGVDVDRLDLLILLRLASPLKRPTAAAFRRSLERWVVPPVARSAWPAVFDERVAAMQGQGWLDGLTVTDGGRDILADRLGVRHPRWRRARPTIAALALGLDGPPPQRADGLAARVLDLTHELHLEAPTLGKVADRIAHRQLTGQAGVLTLGVARKVLLEKTLGRTVSGDWSAAARALAAKELGVVGSEPEQLLAGLSARWLRTDPEPADADGDPLRRFAAGARMAAHRVPEPGRYGRSRVYLASLYRSSHGLPYVRGLDLDRFKHRLVDAHRAGLLALHRADLVSAMDPRLVKDSEVSYLNATFHFLGIDPVRSAP